MRPRKLSRKNIILSNFAYTATGTNKARQEKLVKEQNCSPYRRVRKLVKKLVKENLLVCTGLYYCILFRFTLGFVPVIICISVCPFSDVAHIHYIIVIYYFSVETGLGLSIEEREMVFGSVVFILLTVLILLVWITDHSH